MEILPSAELQEVESKLLAYLEEVSEAKAVVHNKAFLQKALAKLKDPGISPVRRFMALMMLTDLVIGVQARYLFSPGQIAVPGSVPEGPTDEEGSQGRVFDLKLSTYESKLYPYKRDLALSFSPISAVLTLAKYEEIPDDSFFFF